jgi:hypothetical protein
VLSQWHPLQMAPVCNGHSHLAALTHGTCASEGELRHPRFCKATKRPLGIGGPHSAEVRQRRGASTQRMAVVRCSVAHRL